MINRLILIILLTTAITAQGKILVFEALADENYQAHGQNVAAIACPELSDQSNCLLYYSPTAAVRPLVDILNTIPDIRIINMSFAWQNPKFYPPPKLQDNEEFYTQFMDNLNQAIETYELSYKNLKEFIPEHPKQLFIASSGHGTKISFFYTAGVALSEKLSIFPAQFDFPNLIKVAAIGQTSVDPVQVAEYKIASYANFGLESVDLLAPVELDVEGQVQKGTSFAVPYVSRVADAMMTKAPMLTTEQVKAILLRSCHVKNRSHAITASEDWLANGEDSDVYQSMFHRKRKTRVKLLKKIGDIALVKCGGVFLKEVALLCTEYMATGQYSEDQACLKAHKEVRGLADNALQELGYLWKIRKI